MRSSARAETAVNTIEAIHRLPFGPPLVLLSLTAAVFELIAKIAHARGVHLPLNLIDSFGLALTGRIALVSIGDLGLLGVADVNEDAIAQYECAASRDSNAAIAAFVLIVGTLPKRLAACRPGSVAYAINFSRNCFA
jgi:hypothetical protein